MQAKCFSCECLLPRFSSCAVCDRCISTKISLNLWKQTCFGYNNRSYDWWGLLFLSHVCKQFHSFIRVTMFSWLQHLFPWRFYFTINYTACYFGPAHWSWWFYQLLSFLSGVEKEISLTDIWHISERIDSVSKFH